MDTSVFAFPTDLHDEGIDVVLDNVERRAGLGGVTLAAVYHASRDVFPHNPRGRVRFLEGGVAYFRPEPERYGEAGFVPREAELVREADVLAETIEAAGRRGLDVRAWIVYLHSDWVDRPRPELCERNAFGDPMLTELCPANPRVRAYVRALTGDVARYGVRTIVGESLHYHPLEHGYHHERYLVELGPRARFLLGLCLCEHCLAAAQLRGADPDRLLALVREELEDAFAGTAADDEAELTLEEAQSLADGELRRLLEARAEAITSLAGAASQAAAAEGAAFSYMDPSGSIKGYATGEPQGGPAPSIGWRLGIDVSAVAAATGGIEALAYASAPDRVASDLDAYLQLLGGRASLAAGLRPMAPDARSAENLAEKVRHARRLGLERVDFYHYGLAPLSALDRIRAALT